MSKNKHTGVAFGGNPLHSHNGVAPKNWKYVVFDLDGTLAESVWPQRGVVGEPIPEGINLLMEFYEKGWMITIDSARRPIDEKLVWEWVKKHNLPVDRVRCGFKIPADVYVDDRGMKFERTYDIEGKVNKLQLAVLEKNTHDHWCSLDTPTGGCYVQKKQLAIRALIQEVRELRKQL